MEFIMIKSKNNLTKTYSDNYIALEMQEQEGLNMDKATMLITDANTGEYRYQRVKLQDSLFDEYGGLFFYRQKQFRTFPMIEYHKDLTFTQIGVFDRLVRSFLGAENFLLIERKRGEFYPLNNKDIQIFLQIKQCQTYDYIRAFKKYKLIKDYINAFGVKYYVVNPLYFISKKRMSYLLYYLFKDEISPYLSKSIKGEFDKRTLHFTKGE